jgi:hypothetical protein
MKFFAQILPHAFDGGILRVRMVGGGMGGWVGGWSVCEAWVDGVMGLRVGFININDMYNYAGGKGVVYAYEAYEAK